MTTLLLRLAGPMQSWGTQSRFTQRETGMEPSKSGVVGLLCAALGMPRDADRAEHDGRAIRFAELVALPMAIRVEREGMVECDYHTAGGAHLLRDARRGYGVAQAGGGVRTVISERYYLADADFLVGLAGELGLLAHLHTALQSPVWHLALGRKSFVPTLPIHVPEVPERYGPPLRDAPLLDVLRVEQWRARRGEERVPQRLRLVYDLDAPGTRTSDENAVRARRQDVPVSFAVAQREYLARTVIVATIPNPSLVEEMGASSVPL